MGDGKGTPGAYNSTDTLCTLMGTRPPSAPVTVVPISGASVEFKVQSEDQEVRDENSSFGRLLIGKDQQRSGGRMAQNRSQRLYVRGHRMGVNESQDILQRRVSYHLMRANFGANVVNNLVTNHIKDV